MATNPDWPRVFQEGGALYGLEPDPVVEAYKRDVDRTLLRENLKLTVEERFLKHQRAFALMRELRRAGEAARAKR